MLVVFLFFVVLVVDAVVQLSIVICLVLPVDLFDLGGKFHYSLVYHQVLYTVMVVTIKESSGYVLFGSVSRLLDSSLAVAPAFVPLV